MKAVAVSDSENPGLCWVRVASGPFFGEQFFSTYSCFKMGFCQWAEMGPKVGFACKDGSKVVRGCPSTVSNTVAFCQRPSL